MYIKSLLLSDFRNYQNTEINFGRGINILVGKNAQGKTNLVEAVYFLCVGKSPRTPRDKELIRWERDSAYIRLAAVKKSGEVKLEAYLTRTDKKRMSVNGLPITRMGELMGAINAVFFSPDEIRVIKESPAERRRFLDIDLSQISSAYFYYLTRYNKIMVRRNKLLKSGKNISDTLDIWDAQLVEAGAKIAFRRKKFIELLKGFASSAHQKLTDGKENLELTYEGIAGETEEEIAKNFKAALLSSRAKDIDLGYTTVGMHKDDISFCVDGVDMRSFGSQGQQRTTALSLKLAELEVFNQERGEYPVLILDDVFSELDSTRRARLLSNLKSQTIITTTDFSTPPPDAKIFNVTGGTVKGAE